ncbi:MAG: YdcF family protein [Cyanobacteriota bacterium]
MFDSPLCDRKFTTFPLFLDWGQFDWLKIPLLLVLLLLTFFGLRQIIRRSRWKRHLSSIKGILLLTGLTATLLILLAVADKGLVLFVPADSGAKADAIVVLGRGTEFGKPRLEVVTQLWQAKRAPVIFVSGTYDAPRMLQKLEEKGIPKSVLDGEDCSLTTPENALFTAAILQPRGIQRILLVTDGPHMWRSLLDLRDQGFTVIPHISPLPNNMAFMDKTFLTFREYLFLISSSVHQLFHGQRVPNVNSPELQNLVQLAKQYSKQQRFP